MKLIWHEFKMLTAHWKWFIPLWWLIVFIDFGYQSAWWWEGGAPWETYSEFHSSAREFTRSLIWIGLGLAAYQMAVENSPARQQNAGHLRPFSNSARFVCAVAFLSIFVGLPWWLHETVYLTHIAEQSATFTVRGVFERILFTFVFWSTFGVLGWVSGTFLRAAQILALAFLANLGFDLLEENLLTSLNYFDADSNRVLWWERFATITTIFLLIAAALALLAWHAIKQRATKLSSFKSWTILGLLLLIASSTHLISHHLVTAHLFKTATDQNAHDAGELFADLNLESQSLHSTDLNGYRTTNWPIYPRFPESPGFLSDIAAASGSIRLKTGEIYDLVDHVNERSERTARNFGALNNLDYLEEFPTLTLFSDPNEIYLYPQQESITLYPPPQSSQHLNPENFDSASAELVVELLKRSDWHHLPLDGTAHSFGSLGTSQFADIKGTELKLATRTPCAYTISQNGIKPFRQFAFINRKKGQLILSKANPDQQPDLISGSGSAAPLFLWKIYFGSMVDSMKTAKWRKDAELIMFEAPLVGRVRKEIKNQKNVRDSPYFEQPETEYRTPEYVPRALKPDWAWENPSASEAELRKALYELFREALPEDCKLPPFHNHHRTFFRDAAMKIPGLINLFQSSWTTEDRDHFLKALTLEHTRSNYSLARDLQKCNWLHLRPDWIEANLESHSVSLKGLAEAAEANRNPEKKRVNKYLRSLYSYKQPPVVRATYPEIWDERKSNLLKNWNDRKFFYQLPFRRNGTTTDLHLARMGHEEALRKRLESYIALGKDISPEPNSAYIHNKPAWLWIEALFGVPEEETTSDHQLQIRQAEKWLKSDWVFQPESMTYRILP